MAVSLGIDGDISVSSGTQLEHLFDTGGVGGYQFTLTTDAPAFGGTAFAATPPVSASQFVGIPSWSVSFQGRFPKAAPQTGYEGNVTHSTITPLHLKGWSLNMGYAVVNTTEMAASAPAWNTFAAGLLTWGGTFDAGVSDTTDVVLPSAIAAAAATLKLTEEGATDNEFTGNIIANQSALSVNVESSDTNRIPYNFAGSGDLTVVGSSNVLPAGAVARADAGTVVFTVGGSKTHTGSCFLSQLSITCNLGQPIAVSGQLQGTGALTLA